MSEVTTGPHKVKVPDRVDSLPSKGWVRLDLKISKELSEAIEEIAVESNRSVEDILLRSVALYNFARSAYKEGKHVGTAVREQDLEIEVTGF